MTIQQEIESVLADNDRFQALALVDFNQDRLLFLGLSESAVPGLQAGLDAFLLRLVTNTESHDQFKQTDEFVYYDIEGRQLVCHYFESGKKRCALVAVVSPQKTYKQIIRRLAKALKPLV